MPPNDKRREAARRQLERQLQARQEREARQRRIVLISSISGTVVVIALIVVLVVVLGGGGGKKTPAASSSATVSASATATSASPTAVQATGAAVTFNGVTIGGAADLKGEPQVTSKATTDPSTLEYKDLVVGTGAAAKSTSSVTVQYVGIVYKSGAPFDASWTDGNSPATFTLGPGNVIDGFTQGIAGTTGIPPMKIGGRRVIIIPSSLAYGASPPSASIPANAALVFVIDLQKVS